MKTARTSITPLPDHSLNSLDLHDRFTVIGKDLSAEFEHGVWDTTHVRYEKSDVTKVKFNTLLICNIYLHFRVESGSILLFSETASFSFS